MFVELENELIQLEFACDYEMNPPSLGEDFNTILPLCFDFFNVIVVIKELTLWTFYEYVCTINTFVNTTCSHA